MDQKDKLLSATAKIVAGYVSSHELSVEEIPALVKVVHRSLVDVSSGADFMPGGNMIPAVPIEKSITPDYLICLEDGKKMKMLKRYLKSAFGMTPQQYRKKWGLPSDYPMVAPSYARKRSSLAKEHGLGTMRGEKE